MKAIIYSCIGKKVLEFVGDDKDELEDCAIAFCDGEDGEGFYYYEIR